jgi:hypothetical protein
MLAAALNAFSQGIAYFHAGVDAAALEVAGPQQLRLRRLVQPPRLELPRQHFGSGLPPKQDNGATGSCMRRCSPIRACAARRPTSPSCATPSATCCASAQLDAVPPAHAAESAGAAGFENVGRTRTRVVDGHLDGSGLAGANFREICTW